MHGDELAVAIGKTLVAFVDGGRSVLVADCVVALAGKRPAHEYGPWGAAGDFAAVFEFVAFSDGRFHFENAISVLFKKTHVFHPSSRHVERREFRTLAASSVRAIYLPFGSAVRYSFNGGVAALIRSRQKVPFDRAVIEDGDVRAIHCLAARDWGFLPVQSFRTD